MPISIPGLSRGGGGGGGLHFRDPADIFSATTFALARTARDTAFSTGGTLASVLGEFQGDQSLAIIIRETTGNTQAFETYLPADVGDAYDATQWVERTDAVQGDKGDTGPQARFLISQWRLVASIQTAAPTGGSYVLVSGVLTASAGWSTAKLTPGTNQILVRSDAPINPAVQTGTVTPVWSIPFEDIDEAIADRVEAAQTAAETAQTAAETAETNAETAETNAETAETASELAQTRAEAAQSGAETALQSSGTALAFHDLWSGDLLLSAANQWHALGTEAVPANATWLLWNGGTLTGGTNDGPAALWTWINAARWRALTADTVGTTAGDGTGMLFADWCASDIGDGTPDFTRRDAVIGRTSADIPMLMGPQTGESYFGASLMYITQSVSTPGGGGGASSFSDLSGNDRRQLKYQPRSRRDTELASLR